MRGPDNPLLDGPIPGQSLTTEPGNRPWENPPKMATLEETVDFYMKRLSDPEMMNRMLDILEETDLPITVLVEVMTMGGVMQGLHSVDISVMVSPILVEFIKGAADKAGIDYTLGTETQGQYSPELLRATLTEMRGEPTTMAIEDPFSTDAAQEPEEEAVEEKPSLMARRSA